MGFFFTKISKNSFYSFCDFLMMLVCTGSPRSYSECAILI